MTSPRGAMAALRAREAEPLRAFVQGELDRRGWTAYRLAKHAFGVNETGRVINSGYVYQIMKGDCIPDASTVAKIANTLEVPPETIQALLPPPRKRMRIAENAVAAPVNTRALAPPPAPKRPDQFSLTIDGEGRAVLRVHLTDLPMDKAMRVLAALTSAGLLPTGAESTNAGA